VVDQMLRVADVAARLCMSVKWVRNHFAKVPGVIRIPSPTKRGRRGYAVLLIPEPVLDREIRRMTQ
jgi:hypothetical protein